MRPPDVGRAIAERTLDAAQVAGLKSAHYPAPGSLPLVPALLLFWQDFEQDSGLSQKWLLTFRGQLFTAVETDGSPGSYESQIVKIDELVVPIVDAFAGGNHANHTLDGRVDHCMVTRGELGRSLTYGGKQHYGGELFWRVKLRRFAGSF